MYPYYTVYVPNLQLHSDDIDGIQSLYGEPPAPTTSPAQVPDPSVYAASCVDTFDEGDCQALKFNGFCQTEKELMFFYCLKTCFYFVPW
ncbi:uncharacterized protein LOC144641873 isoform X1 [Oculina patagonica]